MYLMLAILAGSLTIMSMIINSKLSEKIGLFQGVIVNYTVGLISIIALMIVTNSSMVLSINSLSKIPMWAYLGGVLGVMVVAASNIVIPKIPAIYTALLYFIGQLFTGILIDYFRNGVISKGQIIGGVLILIGMLYNVNIDKNEATLLKR